MQVTPNDDPALAFRLGVPGDWASAKRAEPALEKSLAPQGLGSFASSAEPGSPVVSVSVTRFPFEVPVDAWVRHTLAQQGYTLVAGRYFPGPNSIFYDATATRGSGDQEEVLRTTAHADGGRVFSVNTLCARRHWDAAKETFWVAHVSFKLLDGTGSSQLEARKQFYAEHPDFRISHPLSWSAEPVKSEWKDVSAGDLRLLDDAGKVLLGYVQVKAQRDSSPSTALPLAALRDEALAKLRKSFNYVSSRPFLPLTEQDDPRGGAVNGWLGGFAGEEKVSENGSDTDVAVRLGFVRRGGVTFSLIGLSAPVRDDTLAAFRTQRAFEIARDTLEPADQTPSPPTPSVVEALAPVAPGPQPEVQAPSLATPPAPSLPDDGPQRPAVKGGAAAKRLSSRVRGGAATISGRLSHESVQQAVRQRFGRIRMCHEQGLIRNGALQGRVEVRFVVGGDGTVSNVSLGERPFLDAETARCVASSFSGLQFQKPEGGVVTVVYPLSLSTEG